MKTESKQTHTPGPCNRGQDMNKRQREAQFIREASKLLRDMKLGPCLEADDNGRAVGSRQPVTCLEVQALVPCLNCRAVKILDDMNAARAGA